MLSPRQALILRKVVEGYLELGQPVGSKALSADQDVTWGPSTVRNELAALEERGLLAHPHTSAGRVPTDDGYRYFVDHLLPDQPRPSLPPLELALMRREVDEAMRAATETLSQVTNLLAIVSAPPIATSTIRHIEVLVLQPQVLMVVVITSTGAVSKRVLTFDAPVDTGLVDWAGAFLNEQLVGLGLGARMLHGRLAEPELSRAERAFLEVLSPAFTELAETAEDTLYMDGAARLIREHRFSDLSQLNALMTLLERRVTMLGALRSALARAHAAFGEGQHRVFVRIGEENEIPALRPLALVGAPYGLPQRTLGTVSLIGPTRMNYASAISVVREAALQLSSFVDDVYDER